MLTIKKFGGTTVANAERMQYVAERCAEAYRQGQEMVVVLSAMGRQTDELIDLARQLQESPSAREMDMLLAVGEQMSAALLAIALAALGVPAVSLNAYQAGIRTDGVHGDARICSIDTARIRRELAAGNIVVVAGFQGVDEKGDYTTLGRGGSDTTAVALAAALQADACEIYTDVDGVYTADPRKVADARKLERISYDAMLQMALEGAQVLHSRCVALAKAEGIRLLVCSGFDRREGTIVGE